MADIEPTKDEATPGAQTIDRADLDNLPEAERKDTEDLLGDIANGRDSRPKPPVEKAAGEDDAPPAKPEDKKPEEEKPAVEPKPEEQKPKTEDGKPADPPEQRRDTTLVPAWKLKVAEDQHAKEVERLKLEIEKAAGAGKMAVDEGKKPEEVEEILSNKIKAISEKTGIEEADLRELIDLTAPRGSGKVELPADISERLKKLDEITIEREVATEEAHFSKDFDAQILPLLKAEYGADVPQETIDKVKAELKGIAYNPDFAKVPYTTIYKGRDEFRSLVPAKVRGAEKTRGGTFETAHAANDGRGGEGGPDWSKLEGDTDFEFSDDELRSLSDADFEKYGDIMQKRDTAARQKRNADAGR